jgi:hypothetical protein
MSKGPAGRDARANAPRSTDAQAKPGIANKKRGDILSPRAFLQHPLGLEGCDPLDALRYNPRKNTEASAQIVSAYRQRAIFLPVASLRKRAKKSARDFVAGAS